MFEEAGYPSDPNNVFWHKGLDTMLLDGPVTYAHLVGDSYESVYEPLQRVADPTENLHLQKVLSSSDLFPQDIIVVSCYRGREVVETATETRAWGGDGRVSAGIHIRGHGAGWGRWQRVKKIRGR